MKDYLFNLKKLPFFTLLIFAKVTTTLAMVPPPAPVPQLQMKYTIVPKALDAKGIDEVENIIGYRFKNKELLVQALTTRAKNPVNNYERLELLGDKVLDTVLINFLLQKYQDVSEGKLTDARTALVSQEPMAALCLRLSLHSFAQDAETILPISTLCDIVESLIGAMNEDGGLEVAKNFVLKNFVPMIKDKMCPIMADTIIKKAAQEINQDISYRWIENNCTLINVPGRGLVNNPSVKVSPWVCAPKDNEKRLARYLAERKFIKEQLPAQYQNSLVRLATDPDYKPLDKAPALNLSWEEGFHTSSQERLHTIMQKLGLITVRYEFQEAEEGGPSRFTCTLGHPLFSSIKSSAPTKNAAAEIAADAAYKAVQKSIIFSDDIACIPDTNQLDINNPLNSLNTFCHAHRLTLPIYTPKQNAKNGVYSTVSAPWLNIEIKGQSRSTTELSQLDAAKQVISLVRYLSTHYIEPKKLQAIAEYKQIEPTGFLIHLCRYFNLEQPKIEAYYCEGPATEPLQFKTIITMTDDKMVKKTITGDKALTKADAQNNAVKKAAHRLINKMLKQEIT